MTSVGIEIAKEFIDIATPSGSSRVKRTRNELRASLGMLPDDSALVMEATGRYHRLVVEVARDMGLQVRCVNPYVFSLYRKSVNPRAKNDRIDARILQRFGEREWDRLRETEVMDARLQRLKDLLELRDTQVKLRTAWKQSMGEIEELPAECSAALKALQRSIARLDSEIKQLVADDPLYEIFLEIDGVGKQLAPALVWLIRAFKFETADEVVAFVGLDVRVRESGKYVGLRKLTKRGPAFIRRLLYCGANSQRCIKDFKPFFEKHHARGRRTRAVNVIACRRILKAALALSQCGARYNRAKYLAGT
jgi:transposase